MKVILLENVAQVGQKYEIKDVPRGHALNFLIPRRLAEPATQKNLKRIEGMQAEQKASNEEHLAAFDDALSRLATEQVTLEAPANENGHLYEGVNATTIATQLQHMNLHLSEDTIMLDTPIKETGEHTVALAFGEKKGAFTLTIVPKT